MEQHPIPRQITTFEFKLIGFMTLKQFIYLVIFLPLAYIVMNVFPIPILNIILAAVVAFAGIALAFIPIYDRPLDVYVKNFVKSIITPTQFYYQKNDGTQKTQENTVLKVQSKSHAETSQKLNQYVIQTKKPEELNLALDQKRKKEIKAALDLPIPNNINLGTKTPMRQDQSVQSTNKNQQTNSIKTPFIKGVVKNRKQALLPGILIYINDQNNNPLRLLKTDEKGSFTSFNKLPEGVYDAEIKDPNGKHLFDKVKINLKEQNFKPFEFFSKELI